MGFRWITWDNDQFFRAIWWLFSASTMTTIQKAPSLLLSPGLTTQALSFEMHFPDFRISHLGFFRLCIFCTWQFGDWSLSHICSTQDLIHSVPIWYCMIYIWYDMIWYWLIILYFLFFLSLCPSLALLSHGFSHFREKDHRTCSFHRRNDFTWGRCKRCLATCESSAWSACWFCHVFSMPFRHVFKPLQEHQCISARHESHRLLLLQRRLSWKVSQVCLAHRQ